MIVAALLARNEAGPDRYLARCVSNALRYCDAIVCVDDHSDDDTADVVRRTAQRKGKPAVVVPACSERSFWGSDETAVRAQLWDLAQTVAGDDGWVYIFDADHELVEITPSDLEYLTRSSIVNAWSFPLWDCWDDDQHMRVDGYWQAHLRPRPWLVKARPYPAFQPQWNGAALHSGHIPHNYQILSGVAPGLAAIRHLSYVSPVARVRKHEQYMKVDTLTPTERAHADSIADENPTLAPIPPNDGPRVLIASIIRKPPEVLEGLLKSLEWQKLRNATVDFKFMTNYTEGEKERWGDRLAVLLDGYDCIHVPAPGGDYGDGKETRQWSTPAFQRIARMKDDLMASALNGGYSHVWLVDADVMCDPYTLQALLDADAPIVSGVYWTNWQLPRADLKTFQHAGPQVWQQGSYGMASIFRSAEEFRQDLIERKRLPVGGLGACTLIRSDALAKGVSFQTFRENPMGAGGMAEGEDRHFCARAKALHIPLIADAWSDIWHAYHPAEYVHIPAKLQDLSQEHPDGPVFGDLVSVKIEALEPVKGDNGQLQIPPHHYLRGRYGALPVLPDIEEALGAMRRGESRLVKVHFPVHHPRESMRNTTRIMRITLFDCKKFRYAPVIETELFLSADRVRDLKGDENA